MKRYYLLMFCLIGFSGIAQGQTTMDLLKAHTWRSENGIYYIKFDSQFMYQFSDYSSHGIDLDNHAAKGNYYLSDRSRDSNGNPIVFNQSLAGTVTNGKYIIAGSLILEIVKISSTELQTKPLFRSGGMQIKYTPYTGSLPAAFLQLIGPAPTGIDFTFTNNSSFEIEGLYVGLTGKLGNTHTTFIQCDPGSVPPGSSTGLPHYPGLDIVAAPGTQISDLTLELWGSAWNSSTYQYEVVVSSWISGAWQDNYAYMDLSSGSLTIPLSYSNPTVPSSGRLMLHINVTDYMNTWNYNAAAPGKMLAPDSLPQTDFPVGFRKSNAAPPVPGR